MSEEKKSSGYDASSVESKWYGEWEKAGLFEPDSDKEKPKYSITIPPPNITGSLHMGHALCYSLQDLLGRYKRMQGYRVLILPGQDHAGIATQSVVTKQLKAEGASPFEIGREAFEKRVWEWREVSGDTILTQFRSLGCAFDWSRTRFTLDEGYIDAVLKVFIEWFDRGLIYKGVRVVNWDPVLKTSVSDIETERKLIKGHLYHIKYPFSDGSGHVTIATTRPETMLADVAVAVHSTDKRYDGLIGKTLKLPLTDREIPLIADEYPDPEFGTGAVKITPAHDPNDFEVGQRHELPMLVMMDESGFVTEIGGKYAGLDRKKAREAIVSDLEEAGFLEKIEDHEIAILISDRSKEVIEPLASDQWFVNQRALAEPAIEAVESGDIRFVPERYTNVYLDWMKNIRDWCISRQLWWGHRIPVYYTASGKAVAATNWEEAEKKAGEKIERQEEDVLDTWFSSGLWPFATLGWPEKTADLDDFYPTDVLVTARDIIYLWVARMIMMGLDYVQDKPFQDVYIYATILTKDGKRMSKSLGTGVDPMDVIQDKGADALRYTLFAQTGYNQDLRYDEAKTVEARNFCNKIWNASRFIFMNLEGYQGETPARFDVTDQWILSRLATCEKTVRESYESYDIQTAMQALYQFFWTELCDWYIELSKARLQSESNRIAPQWVLLTCLDAFLKMMHPAMPHITEEIYSLMPKAHKKAFLMAEDWPSIEDNWANLKVESQVEDWLNVTRSLRALRAEIGIAALKKLPLAFFEGDLGDGAAIVQDQAWFDELRAGKPEGKCISTTILGIDLHLPVEGLVDEAQECARLEKEIEKVGKELAKLEARLNNPNFVERAKPEIVEAERIAAKELQTRLEKSKERLKLFSN
ncbi:MAG: valine--tRNA ligase [Armatimonadetes bacterium]|nr:valine--tRNA ligase [Armatimonadota bacterium]